MTQDINTANLPLSFLKLAEFQNAGKYVDVTIQCGNDYFKCHRVTLAMASTFFDYLFNGFPNENSSVLNLASSKVTGIHETFFLDYEVPAVKEFELILQYIYSGFVETNYANYNRKLEIWEYFGLTRTGLSQDPDSAILRKFYSKLEEFRVAEKYSDVTIECETKCFKCHRVILATASGFFDNLFSSRKVDIPETFVLADEVRLVVFEPILKFIYCGQITIDSSNICNLLRACEYFRLTGRLAILSLCEKFASENRMSFETTTEALRFANDNGLDTLSSILMRKIAELFASGSESKKFLSKLGGTAAEPFPNDEPFLGASSRWNSDLSEEIVPDQNQLMQNMSEASVAETITEVRPNRPPEIDYRQVRPEMSIETVFQKDLKVYLRNTKTDTVNIFSINDENNFNFRGQVWSRQIDFRAVALDEDHLCCLHYIRRPDTRGHFVRSFRRYSSADLRDPIKLKDPPLAPSTITDLFLCASKNDIIYAYTESPNRHSCRYHGSDGIHFYNCFLDDWFPVPPLENEIILNRCATTQDDILYLFGKSRSAISVQTYDRRTEKWSKHQGRYFVGKCGRAISCCANDTNKIYVFIQSQGVASYDMTAQKWVPLFHSKQQSSKYNTQLISHSGKIWAMGNTSKRFSRLFKVEVYDNNNWKTMNTFTYTANDFPNDVCKGLFLNAVVFR